MRVSMTVVCMAAFASPVFAEDVRMQDLPDAVLATVEKESKEAIVEDIERKKRGDTYYYELEIERGDEDWKIHIDEDGKVLKRKRDS